MSIKPIKPSLGSELVVAFALSLACAAVTTALMLVLDGGTALRVAIAVVGLAYLLYRLACSRERTGRVVIVALWCAVSALTWAWAPPLALYLGIHVTLVWLIRSLYAYSSLLAVAADLGLTALAVAVAAWAFVRSGSMFLATWCFFLVQALHVAIPTGSKARGSQVRDPRRQTSFDECGETDNEAFVKAYRAAEAAVRRLAPNR